MGDTVRLTLMLNETGWKGIKCYSKEERSPNYRPYMAVTNIVDVTSPYVSNISIFKMRKPAH